MTVISNIGVNYFFQEALSWDRTMNYFLQENAFFKTRLAQVLENKMSADLLEKAEYFQNSFIHNDEGMKGLKTDIDVLLRQIKEFTAAKNVEEKDLAGKYRKLDNEIKNFTKKFEEIKSAFNQYLISFF
jgi:predicted  nucleic acid-binding Zn-ribbon protein